MTAEPVGSTGGNLRRVADALGVPVATFFSTPRSGASSGGVYATLAEARRLVVAFLALRDPAARARCIDAVEAELADDRR